MSLSTFHKEFDRNIDAALVAEAIFDAYKNYLTMNKYLAEGVYFLFQDDSKIDAFIEQIDRFKVQFSSHLKSISEEIANAMNAYNEAELIFYKLSCFILMNGEANYQFGEFTELSDFTIMNSDNTSYILACASRGDSSEDLTVNEVLELVQTLFERAYQTNNDFIDIVREQTSLISDDEYLELKRKNNSLVEKGRVLTIDSELVKELQKLINEYSDLQISFISFALVVHSDKGEFDICLLE